MDKVNFYYIEEGDYAPRENYPWIKRENIAIIVQYKDEYLFLGWNKVNYQNSLVTGGIDNNEEKESAVIRELREEEQEILLDQIKKYNLSFASSYPITDLKPLNNQSALMFALKMTTKTGQHFMESDIEKELPKYSGKDHPYVHEDIECFLEDGPLYKYNRTKNIYLYQ